jgi:ubiquinone/menaquinone biosynthesis C-methylase UbiE
LGVLAERFPAATLRQARAEALPFESASMAAVVGVCVLDVVPEPELALRELSRVLVPGGVVIHLLDMAPRFETELAAIALTGELVLPNLFADPSASVWPEDMLVSERAPMLRLLAELARREHPLPHVFGPYFERFARTPFDAASANREYETFCRDSRLRELLKELLTAGYTAGFQLRLPPPPGRLVSSGQRLAERLALAAHAVGLDIVLNEPRAAWAHAQAEPSGPAYRSLALGHERRGDVPERLLCADAVLPESGRLLLEASMLVTVARKPLTGA